MNNRKVFVHFILTQSINSIDSFIYLEDKPYLELLLSVAVGSQLGDVFLHLLPEAYSHAQSSTINIGLWTLFGLFIFFIIEQIFPEDEQLPTVISILNFPFYCILSFFLSHEI